MSRLNPLFLPIILWTGLAAAQDLKEFEKRVTEFTLPNGLHFIVAERHEAPVVSFHTYVKAGSVDDPAGLTGLAHMFEHMAFKGTEQIGARNWPAEKKALEEVDRIYDLIEAEQNKGIEADPKKVEALRAQLKTAMEKAQSYVEPNEFPRIIEENGGVGLNASTSLDSTEYYYSLPSNRMELWSLLESERFTQPVFREFYKERDVVMEEYRMRTESSPQGKLMQSFLSTAFMAHPYRQPGAGWPSDIQHLRIEAAKKFFEQYYVPGNIVISIVGDVNPADAKRLAEKYFGHMPKQPLPPILHTVEPRQEGPKLVRIQSPSQPLMFIGYKRPDQHSKDDPVFDIIGGIISSGRTGILYKEMVRDRRVSLAAAAASTFPDGKYPNVFLFFLVPSLGHTIEENEKIFYEILDRFKAEKVDEEALSRVKTKTRASLIRRLDNNSGLASLLAAYHAVYGDWRKLFTSLDDLNKVTSDDVRRVANQYFTVESRTVAHTYAPRQAERKPSGGSK